MVNEEIYGGMRAALARGQTLKSAMISLYDAGYKKEEIEEAARFLVETDREAERLKQEHLRLQEMQEQLKKGKHPKPAVQTQQLMQMSQQLTQPGQTAQAPQQQLLAQQALQQSSQAQSLQVQQKPIVIKKPSKQSFFQRLVRSFRVKDLKKEIQAQEQLSKPLQEEELIMGPEQAQQPQTSQQQLSKPVVVQKVSGYEDKRKLRLNKEIIILGILVAVLLLGLITMFLFKDEIVAYLNQLSR